MAKITRNSVKKTRNQEVEFELMLRMLKGWKVLIDNVVNWLS